MPTKPAIQCGATSCPLGKAFCLLDNQQNKIMTTYKYENEDGEIDEMENSERWNWGVVYEDGEELHQFGQDGWFHSITEVDQERVDLFSMYKPDGSDRHDLKVTDDMQIFHFYRHVHASYFENHDDTVKVYVYGFKKDGTASYHFILPDDRLIVSDTDAVDLPNFQLQDPNEQ